jgi:tetratricopeptide (TPR) repeat protein
MRFCRLLMLLGAVLIAAAVFAPRAHAADVAQVAAAKKALQVAVNTGDVDGMLAARGQFDALSVAEPKNALLHYWVAVCDWRVAPLLMGDATKDQGKRWVAEGIARADQAYALVPKFVEALALRCGLQGMSIQLDPSKAMPIGIQMGADLDHALSLAPNNPRVRLLDGISTLFKPGFVGGGAGNAIKALEKAQALYAAETVTDPAAPDWGKDDAFVWAGRAAVKAGDYKSAKGYYLKALAANPDNGWVKGSLLPAVEKQLGAKANS